MTKTKLIIRMIDIVFILLFGFIAVSQIDSTAGIEPPESSEAMAGTPEGTRTIIIGVTKEGTYPINTGDKVLNNLSEVKHFLTELAQQAELEGLQLGIRIRANWDSPVENGLAIAKICKNLGLPKGLDVVKKNTH